MSDGGEPQYQVNLTRSAFKDLKKLSRPALLRVDERITSLNSGPRPHGSQKLAGSDLYRVRVGDYRILYEIDDAARVVTVERVRHRSDAYDNLS